MKILFDHQTFDLQRFGGISRYFFELLSQFENDGSVKYELPIIYSNNEYLRTMDGYRDSLLPIPPRVDPYKKFLNGTDFTGKRLLFRIRNKFLPPIVTDAESQRNKQNAIEKIKEGNFDVFHPTYYDDYFLEFLQDKPYILTVYDLIHQVFPDLFLYDTLDKGKEVLQKAAKIIAISHSTKRDLVSIFGVDEEKVCVTHLANSLQKNPGDDTALFKAGLPRNYLLYVGNRNLYKNFMFFIQAAAILFRESDDLQIICTGPVFNHEELYFFKKLGITHRLHHFYVDDAELCCLYENAAAFIFPSMYEGFGLPILEAFSLSCPVVASNISSLPEVGGEAALYFEPKDITSLLAALRCVLVDSGKRNELVLKGHEQLNKFSWQKTAEETKNVYQEVLRHQNHSRAPQHPLRATA